MGKFFKEAGASRRAVSEATKGMKSFITKVKRILRSDVNVAARMQSQNPKQFQKAMEAGASYEKLMKIKKKLGAGKHLSKADKKVWNKLDKLEKKIAVPEGKWRKDPKEVLKAIKEVGL